MNVETYIAEAARIQRGNDFAPTASEIHSAPLKFQELRARLKHIAGLCWGLSIDLQNEIELREALERCYNNQRKALLELFEQMKNSTMPASEQVRFYKQGIKKILYPNGVGSRSGADFSPSELTPEEFEARAKKRQYRRDKQPKKQVKTAQLPDEALSPEDLAKRERKREYNRRYMEKKRAAQAQGGNNDSTDN